MGDARVSGRVLGPSGRPVESFRVELHSIQGFFPLSWGPLAERSVDASRDGFFEIEGVGEGSFVVEAFAPDLAPGMSRLFFLAPGGSTTGVDVHLGVGGEVRGLVLDSRTGEPLVGAEVATRGGDGFNPSNPPGMTQARVQTGPDGRYRIEHVGRGAHTLTIHAQGRAAAFVDEVCVAEGKVLELPPQSLGPGATIAGVVLGPEGAPLANASVQLGPANQAFPGHRTTRADSAGAYRLEDVTLGVYELSATRPNSGSGDPFEAISDMKRSQRTIRLEAETSYAFDIDLRER
jgi:carboxypeptidase family protein